MHASRIAIHACCVSAVPCMSCACCSLHVNCHMLPRSHAMHAQQASQNCWCTHHMLSGSCLLAAAVLLLFCALLQRKCSRCWTCWCPAAGQRRSAGTWWRSAWGGWRCCTPQRCWRGCAQVRSRAVVCCCCHSMCGRLLLYVCAAVPDRDVLMPAHMPAQTAAVAWVLLLRLDA